MALNTTGLAEAYARQQNKTANATDIANLNYATSKGWKPTATTPAGSVAIPGAQYNTKELQQANFSNIQPVGGTLYGTPIVKTAIDSASNPLPTAGIMDIPTQLASQKTANQSIAQAQAQNTQIEDQARQSAYSQQLQSLAEQVKSTMPTETFTAEQQTANKQNLLAKQKQISDYSASYNQGQNLIEDKQIPMQFITGQQASNERRYVAQSQALSAEEANLINTVNLSSQEKQQIIEGTKTIADYQSNIQNYIDNEKQSILQQSQVLTENQKNAFATTLQMLQGVNPDKMTAQQSAQLAELAQGSGIGPQLVMAGLKTLYNQQSLDNSLKQQELNNQIANTKFNQNLATQNLQLDRSKFSSDQAYREAQIALDYAQMEATGSPVVKPITDLQRKANGYATRMTEANDIILKYEKLGSELIGAATQYVPNILKSADRQAMEQAQRNFINAVLRQESGAAIAPTEFDSAKLQYFPQPGDSQKVIDQKRANRQTSINGMIGEAGAVNSSTSGISDGDFNW